MSTEKTFEQFKQEVEELLMKRFGITVGDCTDDEAILTEFNGDADAWEFTSFIRDKYDLDELN